MNCSTDKFNYNSSNCKYNKNRYKMKLAEIIEGYDNKRQSPRGQKIKEIADACKVSISAVYAWIDGRVIPAPLYRDKVEEVLGEKIDW